MNNNNIINTNISNANVLNSAKQPTVMYVLLFLIIILIVFFGLIVFKVPLTGIPKSKEESVTNIILILLIVFFILGICAFLLPNFKDILLLFRQISNVSYVIIYTIFLILFLTLVPNSFLDTYAKYITPITALLGIFLFYKSIITNYVENFNINYERIKTIIIMFCLIVIFITYYNIDPGKHIKKYLGFSFLLTIIIAVFSLLYLIILFTVTDKTTGKSFFSDMSSFGKYGTIAFIIFLISVTVIITLYPGGFFNDKQVAGPAMVLLLLVTILSSILFISNMFPEINNASAQTNKLSLFKRSILILFGIVISSLLIFWIVYNVQNLSGQSSVTSFVLNILIVTIVLGLIYKTIIVKFPSNNSNKNGFFSLILNTLLYIPCLFSGLFTQTASLNNINNVNINNNTTESFIMLGLAILLFIIYFQYPKILNKITNQNGKQLLNQPVYINKQYTLGNYEELNGSDNFDYQYAISAWIFIDAAPPNMNPSYNKYTSLLNFGNKPNIMYNGKNNTLMIIMEQKEFNKNKSDGKKSHDNKLIDFDEDGNRIIYKNENMLLQKWNNIVINYNGGILDIFLNGELVKSALGVVSYYTLDSLTIGENNGIEGGICNVNYFNKSLDANNIYYLYNMVKHLTPPVVTDSNVVINDEIKNMNSFIKNN